MNDDVKPPSSQPARGGRSTLGASAVGSSGADVLTIFTVEVGAWLSIFAAAALGFGIAGAFGVTAFVDPSDLRGIQMLTADESFASRAAILLYAAVVAAGVAGLFVPSKALTSGTALKVAIGAAAALAILAVVSLFVVSALLTVVMGLCVGAAFAAVLSLVENSRVKPWRSAGVAATLTLVTSYGAQLLGGSGGGHAVMPWLALLGALVLLTGVLLLLRTKPEGAIRLPDTGAHVLDRTALARPASPVTSAWPCHLLFAVLGAVGILAQPSVADLGFGQGGMSLIICAVLLGWAVGFETGPHFAPGMIRTRLTSFALLAAGVLTIATGLLEELSGRAVLSGGIAFLVGLGVRSQRYAFSRRTGAIAGMGAAVLLTALGVETEVPLSSYASWVIHPADLAYVVIGAVALVGGGVALFTFGPTGIRGLGVDVVHAFRVPAAASRRTAPGHSEAQTQADSQADSLDESQPDASVPAPAVDDPAEAATTASAAVPADGGAPAPRPGEEATVVHAPQAASAAGLDALDDALEQDRSLEDRGFFIAIEGGDGTGKSTQIHLLADALRDRGAREVVTTREPGGTEAGTKLRGVVLDGDGVTDRAEALVFAADRAHHVASLIRPVMARDGIVITDRYIDSSRAYQAAGRDLGDAEITALSRWATEGLQPDLTIILDANPAVTRQRTTKRGDENHLDQLDTSFHATVRQAFLDFAAASPQRYAVVDAGRDIDTVAAQVMAAVDAGLARKAARRSGQQPHDGAGAPMPPPAPAAQPDPVARTTPAAQPDPAPEAAQTTAATSAAAAHPAPVRPEAPAAPEAGVPEAPAEVRTGEDAVATALPLHPQSASDPGEDETRVVRRQPVTPAPDAQAGSEDETRVVQRARSQDEAAAPSTPAPPAVDPSEAPTTVQPAVAPQAAAPQARESSRERLRAQAEIERRARERLRAQRDGDRRGPGSR